MIMQPIRIQKALSEAGVASRRAAEGLVRQGRVTVNGRKAEIGQSVNPDRDVIAVDGKRVYFTRKKQYRYIMMNKPRGYVTTLSDELGRRCVTDLLTGVEERVYPIGRLDRNSEGLLLFTNDGELANRIMHPASHINKVYRVTVRPDITDEQAAELSDLLGMDAGARFKAYVDGIHPKSQTYEAMGSYAAPLIWKWLKNEKEA